MERLTSAAARLAIGFCFLVGAGLASGTAAAQTTSLSFDESRDLFERNENYAVVVGVDQYTKANRLNYAVADAERLAEQLTARGYVVQLITDYEADPDELVERLRTLSDVITQDGRHTRGNLVFAFSGHGFRQDGENYLATSRTDPENLAATALPMSRLKEVLAESSIRQKVLFIDACRNDPSKGLARANQSFTLDEDAEGLAILYSTGAGNLSWEDPKLGQGVFSYFLSEGLSGEAVDDRGYVTFDGLYGYVQRNVKDYVLKNFKTKQIPYIGGERTGEFVIAKTRDGAPPPRTATGEPVVPTPDGGNRGWIITGAVVGAVVLGVLASGAGSSSGGGGAGGSGDTPLTLVVPTP